MNYEHFVFWEFENLSTSLVKINGVLLIFFQNIFTYWDWEIFWNALSSIATFVATIIALYFGLRKPKPKIEVDYVLHNRNNKVNSFKVTFINISSVNTSIRFRGYLDKNKNKIGLDTRDEIDFEYRLIRSGEIIEYDVTETFKQHLSGGDYRKITLLYNVAGIPGIVYGKLKLFKTKSD